MLMVSTDLWYPKLKLLADRCAVGVGAIDTLALLEPDCKEDMEAALRKLVGRVNECQSDEAIRFREMLSAVEEAGRTRFSDIIVAAQLNSNGKVPASTIQVQLCEYRQSLQKKAA